MGIETIIAMIPKGGKYAKSVVNFVHKVPQNWEKFKSAIQQIDGILKKGKLRLDGKQKTNFEANKNILKTHEKVTKEKVKYEDITQKMWKDRKEYPPFNVSKKDFTRGWKPTVYERQNLRNIYKDKLNPPERLYTKEMEAIDEELNELMLYGNSKYAHLTAEAKAALFEKLQTEMQKLIKIAKDSDPTKLSLSQLNKKSQSLQKRIREIVENPNIKGTVLEGPKRDMIKALYDSENAALTNARHALIRKNSELKYGKKYPVLDPENDSFIILGLDEFGHPIKMSRFTGKFSATKDKTTGELTSAEGTSFYDKWNSKTGTMRKEGEEVFHETLNSEGKVIMSNPEYKLPKRGNMELEKEFYTDLSTSALAKKGYELKDIDMIVKGREARKYLEKTKHKDHNIAMHEQTSTNEIGSVLEDLYNRGDDIYKMTMKEWVTKIPEYFAEGGRTGFHRGSLRHQKEHDYQAYEKEGNFMKYLKLSGDRARMSSPEHWINRLVNPNMKVLQKRDDFETMQKERFMYGEHIPPNVFKKILLDIKGLLKKEKRNKHATGGISNLFRERQGFQDGTTMDLKYINPAFDTSEGMLSGVGGFPIVPAAVSGIALALSQKDKDKKVPQKKEGPKLPDPKPPFKIGDLIIDFIVANSRQPTPSEELRLKEILRVAKEKSLSKDRKLTDEEWKDYVEENSYELGPYEEELTGNETIAELDDKIAESRAYERQMYDEYKTGKLDKYMSMDAKLERVLSADDAGRPSGYDPDEEEEIREYGDEKDRIAIAKMNEVEERAKAKASGSPWYTDPKTLTPEEELRKEFPGIDDRLIKNILRDKNPQRIEEVKQTMREALKMLEKGMSHDDVLKIFKDTSRKKNATGGLIPGYATGGVSNLFRSR